MLKDSLFEAVNLNTNNEQDKYCYSRYIIQFDSCLLFPLPNFDCGKNIITFGIDNISSVHIDNIKKISWFLVKV